MSTALVFTLVLVVLLGHWALAQTTRPVNRWTRTTYDLFLVVALLAGAATVSAKAWRAMRDAPVWDVEAFWLYGHATTMGLDPYAPASLQAALPARVPPTDFVHEVLEVGCVYPPPSLLLITPLGWMSLGTAAVVWVGVQCLCLVLGVLVLWRTFLPYDRLRGLGVAAALTLWLPATGETLAFGQTGLLALLLILLTWRTYQRPLSGALVVGAALVKPFLYILWVDPLVRGRWRTLLAGAVALGITWGLAPVVFGTRMFFNYFRSDPVGRTPLSSLTEPGNASLSAVVLRHAAVLRLRHLVVMNPVFIALVIVVPVVTILAVYALSQAHLDSEDNAALAMSVLIPAGMLIYPGTLSHYSVMLLMPLVWAWRRWGRNRAVGCWLACALALLYALMHGDAGHETTFATGVVWAASLAYIARINNRSRAMSRESRARLIFEPG